MRSAEQTSETAVNRENGRMPVSRKKWVLLGLGLIISVGLPILVFRGVKLAETWRYVLDARWPPLAAAGVFFLGTLTIRSGAGNGCCRRISPLHFGRASPRPASVFWRTTSCRFGLAIWCDVGVIRQLAE